MKFNWGTGIAITLTVFILAMAFAVYKAVQQDFDLVTTDYYEEELKYQEKIDQKENALSLGETIKLKAAEGGILMLIPEKLKGQEGILDVEMYCVTDDEKDFRIDKPKWSAQDLLIEHEHLNSGRWIAKVTFTDSEKKYYFEPEIFLE